MKTLIIYYSQHGSTEVVARTLAKELKTDILEVTDLKNRSGFWVCDPSIFWCDYG